MGWLFRLELGRHEGMEYSKLFRLELGRYEGIHYGRLFRMVPSWHEGMEYSRLLGWSSVGMRAWIIEESSG